MLLPALFGVLSWNPKQRTRLCKWWLECFYQFIKQRNRPHDESPFTNVTLATMYPSRKKFLLHQWYPHMLVYRQNSTLKKPSLVSTATSFCGRFLLWRDYQYHRPLLWRNHAIDASRNSRRTGRGPSKLLYETSSAVRLTMLAKEDGMLPSNWVVGEVQEFQHCQVPELRG